MAVPEHTKCSNTPKRKTGEFPKVIHAAKGEELKVTDSLKNYTQHKTILQFILG